jgi:sterol desaturase/sphingolipid hydroxylase (fatty acid hydroxylase superfamily)
MTDLFQLPVATLFAIYAAFFSLRTLVIAGGMSWVLVHSRFAQARRVYRLAYGRGQLRSELRAAIITILFDAAVTALVIRSGLVRAEAPTALGVLATFAVMFVWYEIWFYATHRLLHTRALYFLHAQHHVARVAHPLTSMSFSLGERAILQAGALGFVLGYSQLVPLALPGVFLYFITNYVLNVIGHSNVEWFGEAYPKMRWGRVFFSVSFHAMHHARYEGHYGLFTQVLDRLFGTYFTDYPAVHAKASRGEGLTRLGARLDGQTLERSADRT